MDGHFNIPEASKSCLGYYALEGSDRRARGFFDGEAYSRGSMLNLVDDVSFSAGDWIIEEKTGTRYRVEHVEDIPGESRWSTTGRRLRLATEEDYKKRIFSADILTKAANTMSIKGLVNKISSDEDRAQLNALLVILGDIEQSTNPVEHDRLSKFRPVLGKYIDIQLMVMKWLATQAGVI